MTLNKFGDIAKVNSDKQTLSGQRGNALIYVIIALALLGGLTMLLTKQGSESDDISYETNELLVLKTTAFAAAAKNTVDQMMMSGTNINNLNFTLPSEAGFDTPPNHNKVFHPDGGGMTLVNDTNIFDTSVSDYGWHMGRFNNIEWTPSNAQDIIFVARGIKQDLCASINKKITGSSTIPNVGGTGMLATYFLDEDVGGFPNEDLTETVCPECEGYPSLCVGNGTIAFSYYNIISAQ